jgi:hypothetical protein
LRSIACTLFLALTIAPLASTTQTTAAPAKAIPGATTPSTPVAPCPCSPTPQHVQPYTAKQETTRVQTLANGTNIKSVEEIVLARDAEGRTYRSTTRTQNGEPTQFIAIFDFPTQTRYTWNVGPSFIKVVNVYRRRQNPMPAAAPPQPERYYPFHSESLPPQTISGVYAQGNRNTRTVPAGYEGNDHDLVTTTESWYSPTVGLPMHIVMDDPRTGKSTADTTDVKLADPDPALFQPPTGYSLRESNQ